MIPAKYWSPTKRLMLLGAMAGGKAVEDTATGNPLIFLTDLARPLKSLLIPFTPQQTGSGDPSPVNIRPIVPWNGLNVFHTGKNLYDAVTYPLTNDMRISGNDGSYAYNEQCACTADFIPCAYLAGLTVTLNKRLNSTINVPGIAFYDESKQFVSGIKNEGSVESTWTFSVPSDAVYMRFTVLKGSTDVQLEIGTTATAYEPYKPITETDISFPSTVYGGTLDAVTGVLTVTMVARVFDGSSDEQWGDSSGTRQTFPIAWAEVRGAQLDGKRVIACNMLIPSTGQGDSPPFGYIINNQSEYNIRTHLVDEDITQAQFRALLAENPLVVVCPLKTPQEIQLTPEQITALVGNNTIWSDADGSMTAVYFKKG